MADQAEILPDEWLHLLGNALLEDILQPHLDEGHDVPDRLRYSVSFPGGRRRGNTIGQAWDPRMSTDNTWEILISPEMEDVVLIAATTLHELIHVLVGVECKHRGPFRILAEACGFVKPMPVVVDVVRTTSSCVMPSVAMSTTPLPPWPLSNASVSRSIAILSVSASVPMFSSA